MQQQPLSSFRAFKHRGNVLHHLQEEGSASVAVFREYRFIGSIWPVNGRYRAYSFLAGLSAPCDKTEAHDWLVNNAKQEGRFGQLGGEEHRSPQYGILLEAAAPGRAQGEEVSQ